MTGFLRSTSTKGLVAAALAAVGLLAGGAIIATGAASSDSKPVPKPLARAIAGSLGSKESFTGVTARVEFTNRLLDSSGLSGGSDPLAGGGSGRLWADPDGRFRIELQSDGGGGDVQVVSDGSQVWLSHGASGQAWKATLPADGRPARGKADRNWPPTVRAVARAIRAISGDAAVSRAEPDNVGGRPAYTVTITPRDTSGLFAGGRISWDAASGAPLALSILAKGQSEPVLDLRATSVEFGPVDGSVFDLEPPADAKTVDLAALRAEASKKATAKRARKKPITGLAAVQRRVSFPISAPAAVEGRRLEVVALAGKGKDAGAILTYGTGLGAIAVIEMPKQAPAEKSSGGWHGDQGALPTFDLDGVEATRLTTALGSVISFERDGVSITVVGSVPADVVTAAAKLLR